MGRFKKFIGRAARGAGAGFLAGGPLGAVVGAGANAFIPGVNRIGADFIGDITEPFTGNRAARDAKKAANRQEDLGRESLDFQKYQYEQGREDIAPWMEAGKGALAQLLAGLESGRFDPSNYQFQQDPGYQFRLAEGEKALSNAASARGGRFGGRSMKDMLRYNQDYASNEYNTGYNRNAMSLSDLYNKYAGISGTGQTTSMGGAQLGQQFGSNYGAGLENIGNVQAAGIMGARNARSQAAQNVLNVGGQLISAYTSGGSGNVLRPKKPMQSPIQSPYAMYGGNA